MILKYKLSDNLLVKTSHITYPNHLQNNVTLEFEDNDGLINDNTYALIKTHDVVERVKIEKSDGFGSCELPKYVSHQTFFKLRVIVLLGEKLKMVTNELIIPIRVNDYLDYQRTVSHPFRKERMRTDAIYDEHMNRYDKKWMYPIIPLRVRNV